MSQNFYMSSELISVNRGVCLGSAEFISAISEFLRKFADFICAFPDVFTSYFFIQPKCTIFSFRDVRENRFIVNSERRVIQSNAEKRNTKRTS